MYVFCEKKYVILLLLFYQKMITIGDDRMSKVLLGMSGGVDSSAAAVILMENGHDVTGVTLELRPEDCSEGLAGDARDAAAVAEKLGIRHIRLDMRELFSRKVIDRFVDEYIHGRTPNPCISCNRHIKFGAMLDYALENGYDFIATGHYARIEFDEPSGRYRLLRSPSPKDQSYVLYNMTQRQLAHTMFPLCSATKEQTRELARRAGLDGVSGKSDSQEICFIPDNDYAGFIERSGAPVPPQGNFIDSQGNVLGTHRGILHYTIGQRKGLGVTFGKPMFVTGIDASDNTVTLGENGSQYRGGLLAGEVNLISVPAITGPMRVEAKIRYQAKPAGAVAEPHGDMLRVVFDEPQRSVTPGQSVVLYDGDAVIGGGVIMGEE